MIRKISILIFHVFLFTVLLTSCYTPVEGCLDPESTNYSIEGDNDCLDCCTYPTVKVNIYHQNVDTTFFLEDTLMNDLEQKYSIVKFAYFLSDFKMTTSDGIIYEVEDSIQLNVNDGTAYVKDDIVRVRRDNFGFTFGTAIFEGMIEEFSFKLGLLNALNENEFTTPISGHPLTSDPDTLFIEDEGMYVFQRIQVAQGLDLRDTVIYDVKGSSTVQNVVLPLTDGLEVESIRGKNKVLEIDARYNYWFDEVDFETMTKAEIEQVITTMSGSMFRIHE